MYSSNPDLELKFNSREIFSIMLALQTIIKIPSADPDLLKIMKIIHPQLTTSDEQLVKINLYDSVTLLAELLIFNDKYLHSSFLNNICVNIADVIVAFVADEFYDELKLQNLLRSAGIK